MQGLFHLSFSLEADVVESLGVFRVEAVTSFSCVHLDKRSRLPSPECPLMLTHVTLWGFLGFSNELYVAFFAVLHEI